MLFAPPVLADRFDVLNVAAGGSVTHDANQFRLAETVDPNVALGKPRKSDSVKVGYLGLRFDKPYAQQRLQIDVTETLTRYENFTHLNFDAFDYRGAWLWSLTPQLSGSLSAERKQALVGSADYRGFERNVRDSTTRLFSLDWSVAGGWSLIARASRIEQLSEVPFLAEADFRSSGPEAGIKYLATSGSSITLTRRQSSGIFLNREPDPVGLIDSSYRDKETELKLHWAASGRSTVDATLGWRARRHGHFSERDYSGPFGELAYALTFPGKLRVNAFAKRVLAPSLGPLSSFRVDGLLSLSPSWQITEKSSVRATFERTTSDFRGPIIVPPGPLRRDVVRSAKLSADWAPVSSIMLSASGQRIERSSTDDAAAFKTMVITVSVTGEYKVTVTSALGCAAASEIVNITVDPIEIPVISMSGDSIICAGSSIVLTSTPATSYLWSNGATTQSVTVSDEGSYSVKTQGLCAPFTSEPVSISTLVSPLPVVTNDAVYVDSVATLAATGSLVNWYSTQDSPVPFYTGNAYSTPPLTETTTYWVSNTTVFSEPNLHTGMINHQGGANNDNSYNGGVFFNCLTPFKLVST
ncbi:MAG: XrtB/PEP-CTERM-associated polysaccharide biosynthesis outer membrane protein EpsL, partial [Fimbriimonadaceae bacterium]